jgi:hypothetical protein
MLSYGEEYWEVWGWGLAHLLMMNINRSASVVVA